MQNNLLSYYIIFFFRLLQNKDFSAIILPLQKLRKLVLPNVEFNNAQHNPFPNSYIYIAGIEDEVHILQSLQKPRKIAFRGLYLHLVKIKTISYVHISKLTLKIKLTLILSLPS